MWEQSRAERPEISLRSPLRFNLAADHPIYETGESLAADLQHILKPKFILDEFVNVDVSFIGQFHREAPLIQARRAVNVGVKAEPLYLTKAGDGIDTLMEFVLVVDFKRRLVVRPAASVAGWNPDV
jgi:hypothetical protein